jgi:hypothetical protein
MAGLDSSAVRQWYNSYIGVKNRQKNKAKVTTELNTRPELCSHDIVFYQ